MAENGLWRKALQFGKSAGVIMMIINIPKLRWIVAVLQRSPLVLRQAGTKLHADK